MRALVDLVDSFTGMVRFAIVAMLLVGFGFTLILTVGASYVAPKVVEDYGERASQLGERAIQEARQARRDHELAQDGWGYGSAEGGVSSGQDQYRSRDDRSGGGDWGDDAR